MTYSASSVPPNKLKLLIFNWRDTRHVWAGGAEVYIHEIAKEWIQEGHKVTIFCGNDGNSPRNEVVDGIQIIRRGGHFTVYFWALIYYVMRLRGLFDVVIDCENGIPFFTPFYVGVPKFLLIFHVHQKIFRNHLKFPLREIAQFLEGFVMPRAYRRAHVVTISPSTHDEIISLGIASKRRVQVIEPGVKNNQFVHYFDTDNPTFLYVGRLKPYKNVDIAIRAFGHIYQDHPTARLTIAGTGESRSDLEQLSRNLGLRDAITFTGRITDEQKMKLLAESWAAIQPSSYEGWGLTVIEANAAGTPVIATNVPGLRDAVLPDKTGILVARRDVFALVHAMTTIIVDTEKRMKLSHAAKAWASQFAWDNSAQRFLSNMRAVLNKQYAEAEFPS